MEVTIIDTALLLKMEYDNKLDQTDEVIDNYLSKSELIRMLTSYFSEKSLFPIWRLLALSEIPYADRLKYTQDLIEYIENAYSTSEGFSITGKSEDILPCYNAMLVEAFSKMGYGDRVSVKSAVEWIKKYQVFERNEKVLWTGNGITKYGGCMKSVPCFIGIAKTVKALLYYSNQVHDNQVMDMIEKGTTYLMKHNLYKKLSKNEPITNHILDIAFPQSYQLNIIELLDIAYMTKKMNHQEVRLAIEYIQGKKTKHNDWRINYIYKADGFISFDKRGQRGEWVTYILNKYLNQIN